MYNSIKEIAVNKMDDIIIMIKSINTLTTKAGAPYQKIIVRDMQGNESTFIKFDILLDFEPPAIVKAKIECVEYGASLAIKIKECIETNEVGLEAFLPKAHINVKDAWGKIVKGTKSIRPGLSRILCSVIMDDRNKFLTLPLNPTGAFARQSGILEVTVKLISMSETVAEQQKLDKDLMVAGAMLYYSGNLETVDEAYNHTSYDLMYGSALTAEIKLQAKVAQLISADEKARADILPDDVMLLGHILSAKSGAVPPAIPEAVALKYLSQLLCETDEMNQMISKSEDKIIVDTNNIRKRVYNRQA